MVLILPGSSEPVPKAADGDGLLELLQSNTALAAASERFLAAGSDQQSASTDPQACPVFVVQGEQVRASPQRTGRSHAEKAAQSS